MVQSTTTSRLSLGRRRFSVALFCSVTLQAHAFAPAPFSRRIRRRTRAAASSALAAFSISSTSAEPTTAASAMPPSTATCAGSEIPKPTAIGNLRESPHAPHQGRQFLGQGIRARPSRRCAKSNTESRSNTSAICARRASVEVGAARKIVSRPLRLHDRAIVARFFGRQVGRQHAIGAGRGSRFGEFLEAHLQDRIEIAEKNERHLAVRAQAPDEIEHSRQRGAGAQRAFAGALNRGPSATGSLNGTPSSITSAPASAAASTIFSLASSDGSPAVMYATRPSSPVLESSRNAPRCVHAAPKCSFSVDWPLDARCLRNGGFRHSARAFPYLCRRGRKDSGSRSRLFSFSARA